MEVPFEDLLNINSGTSPTTGAIAPTPEDLPINQGSITVNEVLEAGKQLKTGKAGIDYITTPEALK